MKCCISLIFYLFSLTIYTQTFKEIITDINIDLLNNNNKAALVKCDSLINTGNQYSEIYLLKAKAMMSSDNSFFNDDSLYNAILEILNEGIKLDSTYNYLYGRRAILHFLNKQFNYSILDYSRFIKYSKSSIDIFNGYTDRGLAKMYIKDFSGAISDYEKAKEINSNEKSIYINLSTIYITNELYDSAIILLKEGISKFPKDNSILNNLGFANLKKNKFEDAVVFFNLSINQNPLDYSAYSNRGYCFIMLDSMVNAQDDLNKSISLNPSNPYVYKYMGIYYIKIKSYIAACENFKKANKLGYQELFGNEVIELINKYCDDNKW